MLLDLFYEFIQLYLVSTEHVIPESIILNISLCLSIITIGLVFASVLKFLKSMFK